MSCNSLEKANKIDNTVAENIRFLRKEKKVSLKKLAAATGVTFQQIQKYEMGTNRITAGKLKIISELLEVHISQFFIKRNNK